MCLFCCDMLCWFSLITCCGCRDMVTRRLVFFPPEPYYDQKASDKNEKFKDFYYRLNEERDDTEIDDDDDDDLDEIDIKLDNNRPSQDDNHKDIELKVGTKIKKTTNEHQQNEMEALNSSDERSSEIEIQIKNKRKPMMNNVTEDIYGNFRIKDDETNLAQFYKENYNLKIKNFRSQYLMTKKGERIASYYIKYPTQDYILLFSHGNAADIGLMRNHLCRMYDKCRISIFAYEYTGYGRSSGKPSEKNTYCDIECAYKYIINQLKYQASHIILYGQSLGTCVSVYLASQYPVGGVILHSPLMSGLRVMQHFDKTYWFDIYPVVEQIQHIFAPLWVIHGDRDKEIDIIHGKILSRLAPNSYQPWFVPYAGHNDIEVLFPDALFKKISKFLKYLKSLEQSYKNKEFNYDDNDDNIVEEEEEEEDEDEEEDMIITDDIIDIEEDEEDQTNDDTEIARYKKAHLVIKSMTQKNPDQSISPPPPQSIMTKSQDRSRQITLPSRKFSNTNNSIVDDDHDDEESILDTPSVAASLSMKDSNLISMSMRDDKSTNKATYDQVLTPTMRTIHSKEQSTSEILTLDHKINIDESQTLSNIKYNKSQKTRKSRKNVISSHPGIDELDVDEEKRDLTILSTTVTHKRSRKKRRKKKKSSRNNHNYKPLILPKSTKMTENVNETWKRRDNLPIEDDDDESSESSSDEVDNDDDDDDDESDNDNHDNIGDDQDIDNKQAHVD